MGTLSHLVSDKISLYLKCRQLHSPQDHCSGWEGSCGHGAGPECLQTCNLLCLLLLLRTHSQAWRGVNDQGLCAVLCCDIAPPTHNATPSHEPPKYIHELSGSGVVIPATLNKKQRDGWVFRKCVQNTHTHTHLQAALIELNRSSKWSWLNLYVRIYRWPSSNRGIIDNSVSMLMTKPITERRLKKESIHTILPKCHNKAGMQTEKASHEPDAERKLVPPGRQRAKEQSIWTWCRIW